MPKRIFRCAADIQFDDAVPVPGKVTDVKLKPFSETSNYLQHQIPLSLQHPCFYAHIKSLGKLVLLLNLLKVVFYENLFNPFYISIKLQDYFKTMFEAEKQVFYMHASHVSFTYQSEVYYFCRC